MRFINREICTQTAAIFICENGEEILTYANLSCTGCVKIIFLYCRRDPICYNQFFVFK